MIVPHETTGVVSSAFTIRSGSYVTGSRSYHVAS